MTKAQFLSRSAITALLAGLVSPAVAQDAIAEPQPQTVAQTTQDPDIVVTGSLIRGTPEDAALPVSVLRAEDLAKQGTPSALDLIKNLPVSNGVIGDANQFDSRAQGSEGVASINLRGLGPGRSLVLLNGKRMVPAGTGVPVVDVNLIPQAAIGRVEILKDGAAATYGSDAIAGVVNFITDDRREGFTVAGDYRYIEGSDGDYGGSIAYGHRGNGFRMLASFGYQRRSELRTTDRDFVVQPYANNPQGGWTGGGNPGNFDFNGPFVGGSVFTSDLGCESLGGFRSVAGSTADRCFNNYGLFGNLVEPEERLQAYLETEIDLTPTTSLNLTALYGRSTTRITTSPTYLPTLPPSVNAAGLAILPPGVPGAGTPVTSLFNIPAYAPALRDYCATYGAAAGCLTNAAGQPLQGASAFPVLFRPAMLGGNPAFISEENDRGSAFTDRSSDSFRLTAGLTQELGSNLTLDAGLTYHYYERYIEGADTFGDRLQNALAGFGGYNCPYESAASRAGLSSAQLAALAGQNGCLFFNPFSTAVSSNPVTGDTNPNFAGGRPVGPGLSAAPGAGLVNSADVFNYFFVRSQSWTETQLYVGDLVLSGKSGISLPGGEVGFAIGGQYRKELFSTRYGVNNDLDVYPCPGSVLNPNATCTQETGALGFLGTNRARDLEQDIKAAFVEIQAPITDAINLQLSARYEDYGGLVGSTFDPQARLRFQVTDWLALRGGFGTTFRGPPIASTDGRVTSLQVIGTSFRAIEVNGNPALNPESSNNYSAGIILNAGPFSGTIDYWRYEIDGPIESEPVQGIVNALFGASGNANCADPAFQGLRDRFIFSGEVCNIANVQRLTTQIVNNNSVRTSGLDATAEFRFNVGPEAEIRIGGSGSYVFEYKVGDVVVEGITVQPGFDAVGKLNYQTTAYPLPEWKGTVYASGDIGIHSLRLAYNFMVDYTDQRTAIFTGASNATSLAGQAVETGKTVGGFNTLDFTYRIGLPTGTSIALSALNILDKEPPFARLDQNYDPFTANPLGFTAKISVMQNF